jgi:hypothetical protein
MRSCLVYLGIFAAIGSLGAIALFFAVPLTPSEGVVPLLMRIQIPAGVSFAAALFATLALGLARDTRQRLRDRARLAPDSLALPVDGERTPAAGPLVADGPLLTSPFTGTPCTCYAYEVRVTSKGKSHSDVLVAWGYALTPSHVQAPWGIARLLTLTNIEETPEQLDRAAIRDRVAAYFAATPLVPTGASAPNLGYDAVKQLHLDEDGSIRGDFGPLPDDYLERDFRYYEKVLADREPITAIGTWDARLGGLKATPGREILGAVTVRRGPPETTRRALFRQAIGGTIGVAVLLGIAATIVTAFLVLGGSVH